MNVDARATKNPAELALSAAFAAARNKLPGKGPVAALREDAFRRFDASGLPHRRIEEWKYTDLRALMREAKPLAEPARTTGKVAGLSGVEASCIAIVNGRYEPGWSDFNSHDPGIMLTELFAFAAEGATYRLGDVPGKDDTALSLNTAFMTGGVVLRVKKGASIEKPIHIAHIFAGRSGAAVYPRAVVIVEAGARLTLIESFDGPDRVDYQVNSALELVIGESAHVDHIKVGRDGDAALRISTLGVTVEGKADYRDFAFTTGGAVVRNQTFVRFGREGTQASISGATLIKNRQHVDNTLVIEHAASGCTSRERFRSVLDGESHGVFQGKIVVEPRAQKTDAKMASHALLLSDAAEADNKPELEIFADDVQCGHGATAGALDSGLKFYLMSRGIPEKQAEALLIQAFVGEAIEDIAHENVREALVQASVKWLDGRA
ncbi:MAG TPA: Fe-S cluster assembly protein SufD [Pseudolabrys sp.]|nr:Fe-S cluster assembly protein SufD [Pseudolabrys sp.]